MTGDHSPSAVVEAESSPKPRQTPPVTERQAVTKPVSGSIGSDEVLNPRPKLKLSSILNARMAHAEIFPSASVATEKLKSVPLLASVNILRPSENEKLSTLDEMFVRLGKFAASGFASIKLPLTFMLES
jgi:hypothetical protein